MACASRHGQPVGEGCDCFGRLLTTGTAGQHARQCLHSTKPAARLPGASSPQPKPYLPHGALMPAALGQTPICRANPGQTASQTQSTSSLSGQTASQTRLSGHSRAAGCHPGPPALPAAQQLPAHRRAAARQRSACTQAAGWATRRRARRLLLPPLPQVWLAAAWPPPRRRRCCCCAAGRRAPAWTSTWQLRCQDGSACWR